MASKVQDLQKRQLTARELVVILQYIAVVSILIESFFDRNESQNFLQHWEKKNAARYNQTVDGQRVRIY